MGQAAVDLPDPLNAPSPADTTVNADDLLAQMAGAEIDRLLAEQEGERTPTMGAPRIVQTSAPTASPQLAPVTNPAAVGKGAEAGSLNGVLSGIAPATEAGPDPLAKLAAPPQSTPGVKSTAELLDEELAADEARSALSSARFKQTPDAAAVEPAADVSFPLRALAWVSAPLDACPDHVREAIGKIAIITLVNALAVLFYVLFLRPHHG